MNWKRSVLAFAGGALIFGATVAPCPAVAAADEPLLQQFQEQLNHEWFTLGALLQFVGSSDFTEEGPRGFEIANLRVKLKGRFDSGYSYAFQLNLHKSSTLLDARMSYEFADGHYLDMGAFKAPFSAEALTSSSAIDFVNRSVVVNMLAPGRQIGVGVRGSGSGGMTYAGGVFNGNGVTANGNDDNEFQFVARTALERSAGSAKIVAGANASYEMMETAARFRNDIESETILGGDVRVEQDRFLVAGEYVFRMQELMTGSTDPEAHGFHATGGFMSSERTQVLARFEGYTANRDDTDMVYYVTGGFNVWPTSVTEFQVNVVFPTEGDFEDGQLLVNAQVAF
ncbi:MAG: hypothetical protein HKN20_10405 [Gemmatimonadetes bacterium]|nr:hypothetical protein [Gemmatimonadota bacterium]